MLPPIGTLCKSRVETAAIDIMSNKKLSWKSKMSNCNSYVIIYRVSVKD